MMRTCLLWLDANIERVLMVASYAFFCAIVFLEVVLRYGFGKSTGWGEMSARYAFVYLASIAAAQAARGRGHIRIDLLPRRLSHRMRLALYAYFDVLQMALGTLIVFYALKVMHMQLNTGQMMQSADINIAWAYLALPLGWGLFVYRVVQRLMADVHSWRTHREVAIGGAGFAQ